jgi:hypothetical protein
MRVGVGISEKPLAWDAVSEAVSAAMTVSGPPALAILFTTDNYDQGAVLSAARFLLGKARFVGACGAGLFTGDKILGQGVGVLTLAGEGLQAVTAQIQYSEDDAREKGSLLGERLLAGGQENGAIICFPDGFSGNISRMIDGLYDAAGPGFVYAGGGTGDNLRFCQTWQITDEGVASNSVAGAFLSGCAFSARIGHEWEPTGSPLVITRAKGKVVYELDGRAAFEVYSERLGGIAPDRFSHFAMRSPFGISYGTDSYLVRDPLKVVEGSAIEFVTEIPNRAVAYILKSCEHHRLPLAEKLGRESFSSLKKPRFVLVSYCVSRSLLLGEGHEEEIQALLRPFGAGFPALGFLAFGEIGSNAGSPQLHNKSISLLVGGQGS